jgi:hypothetical protein
MPRPPPLPPQELAGNHLRCLGVCRGKFLGGRGRAHSRVRVRNDSQRLHYLRYCSLSGSRGVDPNGASLRDLAARGAAMSEPEGACSLSSDKRVRPLLVADSRSFAVPG